MTQNMKLIGIDGIEVECEVIALFNKPDTKDNYVVYTEDLDKEKREVLVSKYVTAEDGNLKLIPITDEKEWKFVDEFMEEELFAEEEDE